MDEVRTAGNIAATIQHRGDRVAKIRCALPDCHTPAYLVSERFTLAAGLRLIKYHLFAFHAEPDDRLSDILLGSSERDADNLRRVWIAP